MEPVSLILTALVAGASAAAQSTAADAVKDAYRGLKELIKRKFADKPVAEVALDQYEQTPKEWEAPLRAALTEAGVGQSEDVIQAAQRLVALVDPQHVTAAQHTLNITGDVQGVVQGDHAQVTMTFTNRPPEA